MQLSDQLALAVLAATDAVFIPDRDPKASPRHQVIYERRDMFAARGIPWASEQIMPGLDDTGRKHVQRTLEGLVARGVVAAYEPKGTKTLGASLTDAGDHHYRALAGLPTLADSVPVLEEIWLATKDRRAKPFLNRMWVSEPVLAGVRWGDNERRKAFVEVEEKLLPALLRGLVESNCSVQGHCWYAISAAGVKFIENPFEPPKDLPTQTDAARRDYYYRIHVEIEALGSAKPNCDREIGEIPMPVSL